MNDAEISVFVRLEFPRRVGQPATILVYDQLPDQDDGFRPVLPKKSVVWELGPEDAEMISGPSGGPRVRILSGLLARRKGHFIVSNSPIRIPFGGVGHVVLGGAGGPYYLDSG